MQDSVGLFRITRHQDHVRIFGYRTLAILTDSGCHCNTGPLEDGGEDVECQ